MMIISEAILIIHPTAKFGVIGKDYDKIEWLSPEITKPTKEDLIAAWSDSEPYRNALIEIIRLESLQTVRRMSEAMPDDASGSSDGRAWMKENRDLIQLQRDKL